MPQSLSLLKDQKASNKEWNRVNGNSYSDETLEKIEDNLQDAEIPVTSIPSPFAQLHLTELAFNHLNTRFEKEGLKAYIGKSTYHKLVSHCLDVYEMLYLTDRLNLKPYMDIVYWDNRRSNPNDNETRRLMADPNEGRRTYGESLELFVENYNADPRFQNVGIERAFSRFGILVMHGKTIAGTSPYTGFFASANEIEFPMEQWPKRLDGNRFFTRCGPDGSYLPMHLRSESFKGFMRYFIYKQSDADKIQPCFKELDQYLTNCGIRDLLNDNFNAGNIGPLIFGNDQLELLPGVAYRYEQVSKRDVKETVRESDYRIVSGKQLTNAPLALVSGHRNSSWNYINGPLPENFEVTDVDRQKSFEERTLPGFSHIKYPFITSEDILSDNLIQLPRNVNTEKFWIGEEVNVPNILPPIKADYFRYFTMEDLKKNLYIDALSPDSIEVRLTIPLQADKGRGAVYFQRTYLAVSSARNLSDGKGMIVKPELYMGIFPFFKASEHQYNDIYNITCIHDLVNSPSLTFIRELQGDADFGRVPITSQCKRTKLQVHHSEYFELSAFDGNDEKGASFDTIVLQVDKDDLEATGLIVPLFGSPPNLSREESYLAFDVGTTNTHAALAMGGPAQVEILKNHSLNDNRTPDNCRLSTVFLHQSDSSKFGSLQYDLNWDPDLLNLIYREYYPSLLDEKNGGFPVRTMVYQKSDNAVDIRPLVHGNIPFFFGSVAHNDPQNSIQSNLKWAVSERRQDFELKEGRLRLFIEQLLWLGRTRLIMSGLHPERTNVIWFKPLSMSNEQQGVFNRIWKELYQKYFTKGGSNTEGLYCVTESLAPYHAHKVRTDAAGNYLNIDIGGGTTDLLYFSYQTIKLTTSFRFAGQHLFDSGIGGDQNWDNGYVQKYYEEMKEVFKGTELSILNEIYGSSALRSEDLITYLLSKEAFQKRIAVDGLMRLPILLHNAALFYHGAQIIKAAGFEMPTAIGLSGNGSKLLTLANNGDQQLNKPRMMSNLVALIFQSVFNSDTKPNIQLHTIDKPKSATVVGGIRGLAQVKNDLFADIESYHLSLGDADTILKNVEKEREAYNYEKIMERQDAIEGVVANYEHFIELFCDEWWLDGHFQDNGGMGIDATLSRAKVKDFLLHQSARASISQMLSSKRTIEQAESLNETMFFYPVRERIYALGQELALNHNNLV